MNAGWYYLDTSVAVYALLGHSPRTAAWLEDVDVDDDVELVSSRLLRTEITRVLRREALPVLERERLLVGLVLVPITEAILQQAEAIIPHVKTLDAIHLASALAIGRDPVVLTHDVTMDTVARDLGFETFDPVA